MFGTKLVQIGPETTVPAIHHLLPWSPPQFPSDSVQNATQTLGQMTQISEGAVLPPHRQLEQSSLAFQFLASESWASYYNLQNFSYFT